MIKFSKSSCRLIILALLCALALSLAACSSAAAGSVQKSAPTADAQSDEPTAEPTPEPTPTPTPEPTEEPVADGYTRLTDEDGDGIIQYEFTYNGATVYALFVLDPSRVFVGVGAGQTLDVIAENYGAVAGINAGGFLDEGGGGSGNSPSGITYSEGSCINGDEYGVLAGLDGANQLIVGYYDNDFCVGSGIRDAVTFGPILVQDGVKASADSFEDGIGGRTAIGQRADGTIVMLVADGRQGYSIGLRFADLADIMYDKFGCVTAVNMDGGNSPCVIYNDELLNNPSNQAGGTRNLPSAWLVSPLTGSSDGVTGSVDIAENALGELYTNENACSEELSARLQTFADSFVEAYYGYFGTANADYYYPTLKQYVADDSELLSRMDQALMDRTWVNTYSNAFENKTFLGAYDNGDGTYTILYSLDITEYSNYWTYSHPSAQLRITVYEAPDSAFGFLAIGTN